MMRPNVPDVHISDQRDAALASYRAVPGQAVAGLIFGLLSPLALLDPLFWIVPALGAFFSCWAVRRIKGDAASLAGRGLATAGLAVSLLFAAAAPTEWLVYRGWMRGEARQCAELWFRCIRDEAPHKAHQLAVPPRQRQPFDDRLWDFYRNNPRSREALKGYTSNPAVRALLALGPRANTRFYDTTEQVRADDLDLVEQLYAVTYDEEGERKSFFVSVRVARPKTPGEKTGWFVLGVEGGMLPEGLKKTE
ncbi:MAG: hypothetical protein JW959_05820 [Pirellulales bacterium]|nr:hypothetical protein [Pirellulales bacterium]